MPVSPALYRSEIPFAHLQGARLYENVNNELVVEVQIANEVQEILTDNPKTFGNFVYLSTDPQEILHLTTNQGELKKLILGSQTDPSYLHNYKLSLTRDDFHSGSVHLTAVGENTAPGALLPGPKIYRHSTYKTFVLNRTSGGNVMTGLIADAHIQKVFGGSQQIVDADGADKAAAMGITPIPMGGNQWKIPSDLDISVGRITDTPKRVTHLYILVASYRTYTPQRSSGDPMRARPERCFLGNLTKEVLLINTVSPVESWQWTLNTNVDKYGDIGSVWPGDAHSIDPGNQNPQEMVGTHHTTNPHPDLTRSSVPNIKIKDLRFLTAARRLSFEYNSPLNIKRPYFSPLSLSRDQRGHVHGSFAFDLQKYVEDNSVYGPLIKNTTALLSCVSVADITIYRRVIKRDAGGNKLTQSPNLNADSPISPGWSRVEFPGPGNQPVRKIDLFKGQSPGIANLIFLDTKAQDFTAGTLEYKAEITIGDDTRDVLTNFRDGLLEVIALNYNDARSQGVTPNFQPIITRYLAAVNFLFGTRPFQHYGMAAWKKNLQALVAPVNPSDADKVLVIDLIRDFITQLSQQLATMQSNTGGSFHVYSSVTNPGPTGVQIVEHEFRNRYKVSYPKSIGMGYDTRVAAPEGHLPTVSFSEFQIRINLEVAKYALINPGLDAINPYGYLSSAYLYLGPTHSHRTATSDFDLNPADFLPLFRNNVLDTYQYSPPAADPAASSMGEIFAAAGAAVIPLQESLREVLFPETDPVAPPVPPSQWMGTMSLFNFGGNTAESALSGSNQSIQFQAANTSPTGMAQFAPAAQWLLNQQLANFNVPTTVNNPSNIPNSLALAKFNEDNEVIENSNTLSNMVNFEELVRVEYLESYDSNLGVAKPVWKILDTITFENAQKAENSLLCRLVSLSSVIDVDTDLGLPPLNTLFFLGSVNISGTPLNSVAVINEIQSYISSLNASSNMDSLINPEIYYSQNILQPPVLQVTTGT
jgi:hypothetical protein